VLLLATDEQNANIDLLRREQLAPLRLGSVQQFEAHIQTDPDICACVVDSTFTKYLSRSEQEYLLEKIAELSSFIAVRIHDAALQISYIELIEIFRDSSGKPESSGIRAGYIP
jgi:Trm5-related predicted tRNA methylase